MILKLKSMLKKELKQMLRDQKMRMVVFVFPLIQLLIFSFALTMDVKNIDLAVLDYDHTQTTREITDRFTASGYFMIKERPRNTAELKQMLDSGRVRGAVIFAKGTEKNVQSGKKAEVQVIGDATMTNDAGIIMGYASNLINMYNVDKNKYLTGSSTPADFEYRNLFNPNLSSRQYYIPGLVALMVMVTSMLLTSIAIVREKEIGTIEQIMVTPIGRFEFILGKTLPFSITGSLNAAMMFTLAYFIFGITVRGSILLLAFIVLVNISIYLGLALLVSASARTQQQALLTSFFLMMPCALLSGYMFPVNNMPDAVQYLTYLDPMRWGLEGIIGVVVKGAGVWELKKQLFWLCLHSVFFITFASLKFKKTLE